MTEGTCVGCGGPLTREKWNSSVELFVCDNFQCSLFRKPIHTPKQALETREEILKIPEWLGGPNGQETNEITSRLQKLRRTFFAQEKDSEIL